MKLHPYRLISWFVVSMPVMPGDLFRPAGSSKAIVMFSMTSCQGRRHDKMRVRHDRQLFTLGV
jgi:hypothetical protein